MIATRPAVHVVNELAEVQTARDGDTAVVVTLSDHRDGQVEVERWVRLAGRWVPYEE